MSKNFNKKLSAFIAIALITSNAMGIGFTHTAKAVALSSELFISEYVEGTSYNKAIEIYNGTGATVDLSKYKLQSDKDGNDIFIDSKYPREVTLSGMLNNGEVAVVYNKDSAATIKNVDCKIKISDDKACVFNGNDQVKLLKDEKEIDRIGVTGKKEFGTDITFVRNSTVVNPKIGEQDPRSNGEWTTYAKDDFTHLGSHLMGAESKVSKVTASVTGDVYAGTPVTLSTMTKDAEIYYTTDNSQPSKSNGTKYSAPITINAETTLKVIAIKDGLESSSIETFQYTIKAALKVLSIKEARILPNNTEAKVEGIVTADLGDNIYIQDDTAGIVAYFKGLDLKPGDKVSIQGKITQFNGLAEIIPSYASDAKVLQASVGVPKPKLVTSLDLAKESGEAIEGQLVEIRKVTVGAVDVNKCFKLTDANGDTMARPFESSWLTPEKTYDSIVGVVDCYEKSPAKDYRIVPRTAADIVQDNAQVSQVIASPSAGIIEKGKTVTLTTATSDAKIYYTVDGTDPTKQSTNYTSPIVINENITIKAIALKDGMKDSDISVFSFTKKEVGETLKIREIQGLSHISPFNGKDVAGVKGVVTAISNDYYQKGFYMQDVEKDNDDKTSEGIFIETTDSSKVKIGDSISIKGKVIEKPNGLSGDTNGLTITEIKAYGTDITVISSGNKLPEPIVLGKGGRVQPTAIIDNDSFSKFDPEEDAIDFYESLESMLVKVNDPLIIGKDERYGEVSVLADNGEASKDKKTIRNGITLTKENFNPEIITIDDILVPISSKDKVYIDKNYSVKVGDKFSTSITAIASYAMGSYKFLNVDKLPSIIDGGNKREVTDIVSQKDKLTVASFNIENFSANENKVGKEEGTSKEKVAKVAEDIIKNLNSPDIVGLVEVQDSNGMLDNGNTDATESFKKLITEIKLQGGPDYSYTDIAPINNKDGGAPGGNIRVGYIYNKARVNLVEKTHGGTLAAVDYNKDGLTLNPGRIDPTNASFDSCRKSLAAEFEFNGEKVIVIANHLSSKGGDEGLYGVNQPPVRGSEPRRHDQAQIVNNFIDKIVSVNPKANIVVLGDLNDFEFSDTVDILKGMGTENVLTNTLDLLPKNERFSYVYQGNSQVLDNVLVNKALAANTKVDVVHINSEFEESHGRISDHDPILIQLKLGTEEIPNPTEKDVQIELLTSKEELAKFKVGGDAKLEIKATNNSDKNKDVTLIVALYDADNKFINYVAAKQTVNVKESANLKCAIKILPEGSKVKCFVWDSLENMIPLSDVIEANVSK